MAEIKASLEVETFDSEEVLVQALGECEQYKGIVILAIKKDGGQRMLASSLTYYEKAFLLAFFQAWFTEYFAIGEGKEDEESD